ncbi:MAG TPA: putative lipid II flippase FtsW [Thermoanaerobaculia bacterium]|jgi:cell division protein FtsW|nr:putative lipid II flippase FtsW [Thermoanaerobaculia bacterium]
MSRKLAHDSWLFGTAMLIVVFGLVMIYSASALIATQRFGATNPYHFLTKQCVAGIAGVAAMLALMHLDIAILRDKRIIYTLMGLVLLGLIVVLFQPAINGKHRWLVMPGFQLQPSEFAKPVIILFLASYLARREDRINELTSTLLPLGCVIALFAGLIVLEDFGTATTLVAVAAGMVIAAGISWRRVALFSMALIPAAAALVFSTAYRLGRVLSFFNPEADPLGKGFQPLQSLIALGTGGFGGLGIGNGRQKLFFLPEPHTDFIFSIIGEELGFLGAILLLGAFGFLVWRGYRVCRGSEERFTFYAALGVTLLIAVQTLINVSVALCLLPTKGLPLPLVSYGGSSLIASLMSIGILLNLSQQST